MLPHAPCCWVCVPLLVQPASASGRCPAQLLCAAATLCFTLRQAGEQRASSETYSSTCTEMT